MHVVVSSLFIGFHCNIPCFVFLCYWPVFFVVVWGLSFTILLMGPLFVSFSGQLFALVCSCMGGA